MRGPAFVAQRIEHLTTDQKVGGSSPSKRTLISIPPNHKGRPRIEFEQSIRKKGAKGV